jgi:integrase
MTKAMYGGTKSRFQQVREIPVTLKDLVRLRAASIWEGKSYQKTAITNLCDAVEIMDNPKLNDIDDDMLTDYVKVLSEGVKNSTINRKLSNLHTILDFACARGWINKVPKTPWQTENNEYIRWLSPEEEKQLLSILPEEYAAFCEILIRTGMRRGELLALQPEQVDGNYARIWKNKTKTPRSVPLDARAKELVEKWVPFKIELSPFRTAWLKAKKEMGLEKDPHFVLHMLRHTAATRVLDTTGRIEVVQRLLGHKKIATTMRYAHVSDDALLDAIWQTAEKHGNVPVTT